MNCIPPLHCLEMLSPFQQNVSFFLSLQIILPRLSSGDIYSKLQGTELYFKVPAYEPCNWKVICHETKSIWKEQTSITLSQTIYHIVASSHKISENDYYMKKSKWVRFCSPSKIFKSVVLRHLRCKFNKWANVINYTFIWSLSRSPTNISTPWFFLYYCLRQWFKLQANIFFLYILCLTRHWFLW